MTAAAASATGSVANPALLNPHILSLNGHGRSTPGPSRSSSSSRIMTRNPSYAQSLMSLPPQPAQAPAQSQQQEHHAKLSSRLRHMFDSQKYAVFSASVTVHELGNVPQLQGEFAVRWKFRGKRPKGKEALELKKERLPTPKPSLPNLRVGQGVPNVHQSSSSASVRTFSTTSSTAAPSIVRNASGLPQQRKALSQPPTTSFSDQQRKRPTDPTPLKQVLGTSDSGEKLPTESPEMLVDEPEEEPSLLRRGLERSRNTSRDSSRSSGSDKSNNGLQIFVHRPSVKSRPPTMPASRNTSGSQIPAIGESPRPVTPSQYPDVRSGTTPSFMALIDPLGKPDEVNDPPPRRQALSRTTSMATTATSSSASGSAYTPKPQLGRTRSHSGPGRSATALTTDHASDSRHGSTPIQSLRAHTCRWDYELQHVIRIPLGKPVPASTSATPNGALPYRQQAPGPAQPLLGAGPQSESGLRLIIEQLPSTGAISTASAAGADNHSLSSTVVAAYHAHHAEKRDSNPSEGHKGKNAQKEKTVFGIVDLDLAMFAGRGRTTRRFLLRGSRTNATIKVTVDMRWIGGEDQWAAPPMQEGHHVTAVTDLVGTEAQDNLRNDLYLAKTPSNSSEDSALSLGRVKTNMSAMSSVYASRNASAHNLAVLPTHNYKPYEHHLRQRDPEGSSNTESSPSRSSYQVPSPGGSPEQVGRITSATMKICTDIDTLGPMHASGPSPLILSLSSMNHHHRHHSHHLRRHDHSRSGIHDLPPEAIIEAIFNPHPSSEDGPFTYVPGKGEAQDLVGANAEQVLEDMIDDNDAISFGTSDKGSRPRGIHTASHLWKRDKDKVRVKDKDDIGESNGNGSKLGWRAKRAKEKRERVSSTST